MAAFEEITFIGGWGGEYYDRSFNGERMVRIKAWAEGDKVRGLKIWMTNDTNTTARLMGTEAGKASDDFFIDTLETITELSLWGNGMGTRLGWIYIKLSSGRKFDFGMTSWGKKQEFKCDVGSGICVGYIVRSNLDIDAFGFRLLRPIVSSKIINVRYPNLALETGSIQIVNLDEYNNEHTGGPDVNWEWGKTKIVTRSSSWSYTAGFVVGTSVTVSAGIPKVAEVESSFHWEVSSSQTSESSFEESEELKWFLSGVLKPGQEVHLIATTGKGTIDVPYNGDLQITTAVTGAVLTYPLIGRYSGVSYTGVRVITAGTAKLGDTSGQLIPVSDS